MTYEGSASGISSLVLSAASGWWA